MTTQTQPWELNVLNALRPSYESRGFALHINPPRELVPEFLGGYEPDALAIGPDGGGIVIEMIRRRSPANDGQLTQLSRKVAAQKGWEFQAVYANPPDETSDSIPAPTPEQLDMRLKEIGELVAGGHYAPAFVLGWATLESLARLARGRGRSKRYSPIQAVQALAEEGYLEDEDARRLRDMASLHSAIVHGDFSVNPSRDQVDFLTLQLKTLNEAIAEVSAAEPAGAI